MAKKKLSTAEILAAARAESASQEDASTDEAVASLEQSAGESASAEAEPAGKPVAPSGAPKSTSDILAAARAQAASAGDGSAQPAKPAAAKTPGSTSSILAAARAQSGSGAAVTGKPAAKESPTKPAVKPAGDHPSVQEMLKAVRQGKPAEQVEKAESKPVVAVIPKKPPIPRKAASPPVARRNVLFALIATPFAVAWTMFAGASAAFGLAVARFMMPNVLVEPPSRFKIGPSSDYPSGAVATKWKAEFGIWVVHADYEGGSLIYALSTVCTHLGCTPNWLEGEQKFKCPCHGSGFYKTGVNFEGPAPRPLERYGIRVAEDGMLEVDKSVKFQEEMGQWKEAASYVEV